MTLTSCSAGLLAGSGDRLEAGATRDALNGVIRSRVDGEDLVVQLFKKRIHRPHPLDLHVAHADTE